MSTFILATFCLPQPLYHTLFVHLSVADGRNEHGKDKQYREYEKHRSDHKMIGKKPHLICDRIDQYIAKQAAQSQCKECCAADVTNALSN